MIKQNKKQLETAEIFMINIKIFKFRNTFFCLTKLKYFGGFTYCLFNLSHEPTPRPSQWIMEVAGVDEEDKFGFEIDEQTNWQHPDTIIDNASSDPTEPIVALSSARSLSTRSSIKP
jgi:hypothetical protein